MLPSEQTLVERLEQRGVSRRAFLNFCGVMAATLALPASYRTQIAEALASVRRPVLIWRQFQDCAGNSESILRSPHPDVAEIVLETFSWNYHELIMAGAGEQAEAMSTQAVRDLKGKYIAVIEGAIPSGADGATARSGAARRSTSHGRWLATPLRRSPSAHAPGTVGWSSTGRPAGEGVQDVVPGATVVNLGGCPHNPANTVAVLVHYLTFNEMPALDQYNRPLFAYGDLIHDQCERRAYYDAGLFVEAWGDEGHRKGYCLYKMGARVHRRHTTARTCAGTTARAGRSRPAAQLHRLRLAELLGNDEPVLQAAAQRTRVRRRHDRADGRADGDRRRRRADGRAWSWEGRAGVARGPRSGAGRTSRGRERTGG